jgi:hypothetical protein
MSITGLMRLCAFLICCLFLAGIIYGCGNTPPKSITQTYIDALKSQNYRKAWSNLSKECQNDIAGYSEKDGFNLFKKKNEDLMKDGKMKAQLMSSKALDEKIEGNTAIVTIQFTSEKGEASAQEIHLVKDDGRWKIQF